MGVSVTAPDAEKVMVSKSVAEARDEERRTRAAVEEKRGELRELVGASYRDLIDSADNIMEMKRKAAEASERIALMGAGFSALLARRVERRPSEERSRDSEKARRERQKVFRLGSRVKYLVDAPEQIYGFLDVGAYISAAERLLRARHVHAMLVDGAAAEEIFARFPLLNVQWPATEALSAVLLTRSTASLRAAHVDAGDHASASVSGALAAAALAGDLDSESCLVVLLEAREALLGTAFVAAGDGDAVAAVDVLQNLVRIVKTTVGLVALLFMGASPVLRAAAGDGMSRDALFGGIVDAGPEAEAWKSKVDEVNARMDTLPRAEVSSALQSWLERAADLAATRGADVMRSVTDMGDLATIEREMRAFDAADESVSFCRAWIETETRRATSGAGTAGDWGLLCTALVGAEYNVWDSLLDGLFVRRVEELLEAGLLKVDIQAELSAVLRATTQHASGARAPGALIDDGDGTSGADASADATDSDALMCRRWSGDNRASSTRGVHGVGSVCRYLDDQLIATAHGVQEVLGCSGDVTSDAYNARAAAVMPLVYRETRRTVARNVGHLDEVLNGVVVENGGGVSGNDGEEKDIRRAVVVGHLCRAIANDCEMIPLLLSPLHTWPATIVLSNEQQGGATRARALDRAARGRQLAKQSRGTVADAGGDTSSHFDELKIELVDKSRAAFQIWIDWTVGRARTLFARDLRADATLQSKVAPVSWETIAIPVKVDSGESSEMKLVLPSSSSAAVLNLLFRGLCQMQLAGVCRASDRDVIKAYAHALRGAALDVIADTVTAGGELETMLSEKGRVQVLFDIDLLVDVLAGANPFSDTDAAAAEAAARGRGGGDARALKQSVSDGIDPIDWATYEPHLKRLEEKYYHRTSVLLGEFVHLNRLHRGSSAHTSTTTSTDAGSAMHTSAPRFAYLPVSMPVVRSGLASSRRLAKTLKMNKLSKSGTADPRQMGTSLLEGDDDVSNKTLDFKSFVDSMGKTVNYNLSGGLFSSLTGR